MGPPQPVRSWEGRGRGTAVVTAAMPSWWPFGKGSDGDAGVSAPELQQADVEKIASVRFVRDFRDGENRVIGLEYLLRWKDGAPDSWEPAMHVAEDLLRDFEGKWWEAAKKADEFSLREALSYGEEVLVNTTDVEGRSALHYVCGRGSDRCAKLLLEVGADATAGDKDGFTALHIAAGYLNTAVVRTLLDAGADPDQKDRAGRSALSLVQGLKRNLPEAAPEYWARRNQMEDTLMALVTKVYEEVPVAAIVDKRVIKPNTGVVVEGDVEVAPGEPTELQYLVRWADTDTQTPPPAQEDDEADAEEGAADTEWLSAEFVAENVIEDYEAGLEYCDAVTLKGKKLMNQMTHYLVQWSDGAADSWEPMPNLDRKSVV